MIFSKVNVPEKGVKISACNLGIAAIFPVTLRPLINFFSSISKVVIENSNWLSFETFIRFVSSCSSK